MRTREWRRWQAEKRKTRLRREVEKCVREEELWVAGRPDRRKPLRTREQWERYYYRNEGRGLTPYHLLHRCRCSWCTGRYRSQLDRVNAAAAEEYRLWLSGAFGWDSCSPEWWRWVEWDYWGWESDLDGYDPWELSPPAWHWYEWGEAIGDPLLE